LFVKPKHNRFSQLSSKMKILFFKKEAKIDIFFIVVVEVYVERE